MRKKTRPIILASRSPARQELLRQIGLKFQVAASAAPEQRRAQGKVSAMVVTNAVNKARGVARRFTSGVVIGADTVVLAGKKIIGKPKSLEDAFRTIKLLSRGPQWVYSGIAVIDIDAKKLYTAYEKTKIYMYALSDTQIRNYFKRVSPLDKAGSFDIQGIGGIFIDRIEGCYFNVVGLPLAKLARILEQIGINWL
ncbi:MAG: Maf family protein [Candidatus Omnitrophota bacterium]